MAHQLVSCLRALEDMMMHMRNAAAAHCKASYSSAPRQVPAHSMLQKATCGEQLSCSSSSCGCVLQGVPQQAAQLGPTGDLLYIAVYAVSTAFFMPASVLTLGAGAVYGVLHGTALASVGSTLGCALAFVIARYLARPLVQQRLQQNRMFQNLERKIPERGAKLVALLRLTPLVPFSLLNYASGARQCLRACVRTLYICPATCCGSCLDARCCLTISQCGGCIGRHHEPQDRAAGRS